MGITTILDSGDDLFHDRIDPDVYPRLIYGDSGGLLQVAVGGDDTIYGFGGLDSIYGDAETVRGTGSRGGNDRLFGGAGDDVLYGDARSLLDGARGGDDVLVMGAHKTKDTGYGDAFTMTNGAVGGDDVIRGNGDFSGDAFEMLDATGGNDTLDASHTTARPYVEGADLQGDASVMRGIAAGGDDTIRGTDLAKIATGEYLIGDGQAMRGFSRGGDDLVMGLGGTDHIYGDAFDMFRSTVGGDDDLRGGAGGDEIYGEAYGIHSRAVVCGDDVVRGGSGNDSIHGDAWYVYGDPASSPGVRFGNDVIIGGVGHDSLWGDVERGGDRGVAAFGDDTFRFAGAFGNDWIGDFGDGDDRLVFEGFEAADVSTRVSGADTIVSVAGGGTVTLADYTGGLVEGDSLFFA